MEQKPEDGMKKHVEQILKEVTTEKFETTGDDSGFNIRGEGAKLSLEQAQAFFERLGAEDFDINKIDGRHCWACGMNECLEGQHFEFVDVNECECTNPACHPERGETRV